MTVHNLPALSTNSPTNSLTAQSASTIQIETRLQASVEGLRSVLKYFPKSGALHWRPRGREMFGSDRAHSIWSARYAYRPAFTAMCGDGYFQGTFKKRRYLAHRVIFAMLHGYWPKFVDHIDGNRLNNRPDNLRACTPSENNMNRAMSSRNTSGATGVSWDKARSMWVSRISKHGHRTQIGYFDRKADAIAARSAAEKALGFSARHGVNAHE